MNQNTYELNLPGNFIASSMYVAIKDAVLLPIQGNTGLLQRFLEGVRTKFFKVLLGLTLERFGSCQTWIAWTTTTTRKIE